MVEDDEEDEGIDPVRFMWSEIAGASANFVGNLARAVVSLADDFVVVARRHSAYVWDRDTAYERMHADIESLPETAETK